MPQLAAEIPPACSACFQQVPSERHVDFQVHFDGPFIPGTDVLGEDAPEGTGTTSVTIDDLIICESCLKDAVELIGLGNVEEVKAELLAAVERAKTLEEDNEALTEKNAGLVEALAADDRIHEVRVEVPVEVKHDVVVDNPETVAKVAELEQSLADAQALPPVLNEEIARLQERVNELTVELANAQTKPEPTEPDPAPADPAPPVEPEVPATADEAPADPVDDTPAAEPPADPASEEVVDEPAEPEAPAEAAEEGQG